MTNETTNFGGNPAKHGRMPVGWAVALALAAPLASAVATGCAASKVPATATAAVSAAPLFEAEAIGPLTKKTELQVVSVFSYEPGETLISPATEIAGFVADARKSENFGRKPFEARLVTPTPPSVSATRFLVLGWGPRTEFSAQRATEMGRETMKQVLALGVHDAAYAPIARDQGVTTLGADVVAEAFVRGALAEYETERAAGQPVNQLKHVTFEAGPAFVGAVSNAVKRATAGGTGVASTAP